MKKLSLLIPVALVAAALALSALFVVDERENVLVLQFGQVKQVRSEPGLGVRIPLIQEVVRYDARILGLQSQPLEVTPLDDRRLVVDAFLRWRITDVVRFREAVGLEGVRAAQGRLERILNAAIREVLGSVPSGAVLSEDRTGLMNRIRDLARREAATLGVQVIDVRLTRTDLPEQNLEATFARMRAEREREAADEIARGNEAAQRVRALADRTVVELVSAARRDSEIIRGEADAERNRVYADAFGRDPEFFAFTRSLTAYERSMRADNTSMVLRPDSDFFAFLRTDGMPALGAPQPPAAEDIPAPQSPTATEEMLGQ
ncbi:protease modulator HflC [Rhodobaculum claviforme]|uniref:Protein HflC n=1 Tax=Rhodobaculum claviforme TaxID=1549854 RepID=A0A934WHV9_9RHOB|nr:protease modulator HflC [Rhodobaculum claviforme]MBK5926206.1 protease modulator HflC [Rhodobaculum claviforme]